MLPRKSILGLATLALFAISGSAMADSKIGVAADTKNQVQGIRGAEKRALNNGSEIFLNEAVQTGDESVAHLVFLDNTNLSVGPGSLVNLDTFIYDPNRKIGQIVVEIGRGAFRFATGSGSSRNYSLKTPHATLGIRGTVFELVSTPDEVKVKLNNGLIQVRTNVGQIVWLTRPETLLTVYANGTVNGPHPHEAPITEFASLIGGTTGSVGSSRTTGGAFEFNFALDIDRLNRSPVVRPAVSTASVRAVPDILPFGFPLSSRASTDSEPVSPSR